MKIVAINAVGLHGETPKGGWAVELEPTASIHTLVSVHTDEGIIGYGSVFTNEGLVEAALKVMAPHYLGENPLEPERVTEKLAQHMFWMGMGGTLTHTQSGINIALWDILGKVTKQPVGRLLGGIYRTSVKPYCSLLMVDAAEMYDTVKAFRSKGFRAFKIGWGPFGRRANRRNDEAIVKAAREAAGGDLDLMVDAGASDAYWPNGYKWALETSHMLRHYEVAWFEEPLRPDALEDYALLRAHSPVPIAGGEVLTRRQVFRQWLASRAFDIVQPDVTKVGGISEQRRIAWMAEDFGVAYVGHGWNTAIGLAADLQLAAAFPNVSLVEYIGGSPYVDNITLGGWHLNAEGMLEIPAGPGLGITIDRDQIARYAPRSARLFAP
jgi:L-alanine-DL-glutamate epimerase-like enolase superfamily enzyme